ncbi:MAG TPA: GGDEF domain-containing protein [Nocardioidaceae bacterium]|nr:GGDEF domain-containing protein [Nocardioidaceae bacterium]
MSTRPPSPDPSSTEVALGPAWAAARRTEQHTDPQRLGGVSSYRRSRDHADPAGDSVALHATRAMLTASTRAEVALVLHTAINDLGGAVLPARLAGPDAVPVDVSLGVGEPKVVMSIEPMDPACLRIAHHLPLLVEDAKAAAARCDAHDRECRRANVDPLTGVASRRQIGRRLAATEPGAVVCMLDVDGLKRLNDTHGHAAGDSALREFGTLLRDSVRGEDFVGRYGGDEFLVVFGAAPLDVARERMVATAVAWGARTGGALTVSGGLAVVDGRGAVAAARAADGALYRSKRSGRDRIELANDDDYDPEPLPFGDPA